ncbi:MAG: DUF1501 domain-containing protein [Candidatus Melainabacteria bacterium]|nr:DUF1501 domain-containing protein [Candidatus Melainabacteria bacterium]
MNRREFLKAALLSSFSFPLINQHSWAFSNGKDDPNGQKLVVVLLRGGVDGLNVVVPYGDNRYRQIRPTIALSRSNGLLDLDGYWGMHPALAALNPLWSAGSLAFVHSCGSPDKTRSHFDAQNYIESGVPGQKSVSTGWMNRLVSQLPSKQSPLRAISLGPVLPKICAGPANVATIQKEARGGGGGRGFNKRNRFGRAGGGAGGDNVNQVFSDMYGDLEGDLGKAFAEGKAARSKVNSIMAEAASEAASDNSMTREQTLANRGALTPKASPEFGKQLATLMTKDPSIQVAFVDFGGWDTHVREGAEKGQLATHLTPLANGLSDLARGLGPMYKNTTIMVMSEFGRTARENGTGGTDHGHGNVMWLLGGGVSGGKVFGRWGGLADKDLNEARDLPTTTDYRSVASHILGEQLGLSQTQLASVFPGFQSRSNPFIQA